MARIAACGGLMIRAEAVQCRGMPRLETVKVPPWNSSGLRLPFLRLGPRGPLASPLIWISDLFLRFLDDRRDESFRDRNGKGKLHVGILLDRVAFEGGVDRRDAPDGFRGSLEDKVVSG